MEGLCTMLLAVVDYRGNRYLAQTTVPGLNDVGAVSGGEV